MAWKKTRKERVVEERYEWVKGYLRRTGQQQLLAPPPTGFGAGQIRKIVEIIVGRVEDPKTLDWPTMFGRLSDYEDPRAFIKGLVKAHLLPPPTAEERMAEMPEKPPDVRTLLENLGLTYPEPPETPQEMMYYQIQMDRLLTELGERLEEAERTAGKVKLRGPDRRYHWYTAEGVSKKVREIREGYEKKIRQLEKELREEEKWEKKEEKLKRAGVKPVKLRILKPFREGIRTYKPGEKVKIYDLDWALEKIKTGYAERAEKPAKKKVKPAKKPEIKRKARFKELWSQYRSAVILHDTGRAEDALKKLRELGTYTFR